MAYKVIGYFVDRDGKEDSAYDVFVAIHDEYVGYECYAPIGQHSALHPDYLKECKQISKEEYLKASSHLYTPIDYL